MAKTHVKPGNSWVPVVKKFIKTPNTEVNSTRWALVEKSYIKNEFGAWVQTYASAVKYTFAFGGPATNKNGILLKNYISPLLGDEFIITVNAGVSLLGVNGSTGSNGANANGSTNYSSCRGTTRYNGSNGGTGSDGGAAIDFTGFENKKVTIINNGTIRAGKGGNGGRGGNAKSYDDYQCSGTFTVYGACGGNGGIGGPWLRSGTRPVELSVLNNAPLNGVNGSKGSNGSNAVGYSSCLSCFTAGQKVLMADKSYKNIEDVKIGDKVTGAYGNINTVMYYDRPKRGNRIIWDIDGLFTTDEHGILNGDKNGFLYKSIASSDKEYGIEHTVLDTDLNEHKYMFNGLSTTSRQTIQVGDKVASSDGKRVIEHISASDKQDSQLYHLITDGDMTYCISDTYVSSMADDSKFDYEKGEFK